MGHKLDDQQGRHPPVPRYGAPLRAGRGPRLWWPPLDRDGHRPGVSILRMACPCRLPRDSVDTPRRGGPSVSGLPPKAAPSGDPDPGSTLGASEPAGSATGRGRAFPFRRARAGLTALAVRLDYADTGRPEGCVAGSTTTGIKSYVPSSRSIASSREHTNVEPRIFTRADSFVKKSYTSAVTLSSPFDRQRTRIRAGGIFVARATSSIAVFSACRSARVGARSNAFTKTAKPAAPRLVNRHNADGSRRTYASNEYVRPLVPVSSAGVATAPGVAIIPRTSELVAPRYERMRWTESFPSGIYTTGSA